MKPQKFTTEDAEKGMRNTKKNILLIINKIDDLVKSRHSREGGKPEARNFLKRMDSRLRTSGMTALKRTFYDVVKVGLYILFFSSVFSVVK
jgi:hypothetical protein